MTVTSASVRTRHLRTRDGSGASISFVELFFDLVYVFAITQLSHLLIGDLSAAGVARTVFLLLVVWWAWIYTTWMVNWFEPESTRVRLVLIGVMLASLLMAAALPEAFAAHGGLFAVTYVVLQVGRNAAGALLLPGGHALRVTFERILAWSVASGVLWLAGGAVDSDHRLWLWLPALAIDLAAPLAGYWTPRRGRSITSDYEIEGGHFAERCQGFIIIALGESIVVTGATAAQAGLTTDVVAGLMVAFVETAALWWLYFSEVAAHSRRLIAEAEDPGRLARDAYTYLHLPIVAGIVATAVGDELLLAHPGHPLRASAALMVVGGPLLVLAGESLFRLRMIHSLSPKRVLTIAGLLVLLPLASHVAALVLGVLVAVLLTTLAASEYRPSRDAEPLV